MDSSTKIFSASALDSPIANRLRAAIRRGAVFAQNNKTARFFFLLLYPASPSPGSLPRTTPCLSIYLSGTERGARENDGKHRQEGRPHRSVVFVSVFFFVLEGFSLVFSLPHFSGYHIPTSGLFFGPGGRISGLFLTSPYQALKAPVDGEIKQSGPILALELGDQRKPIKGGISTQIKN